MQQHSREILLMIGESGSGKSTYAKQFVIDNPNYIRLNRDELRIELATDPKAPKGGKFERFVQLVQKSRANDALQSGKSVIIDDTNLNVNTVASWENFANHRSGFRKYRMMTPLDACIRNDSGRSGDARVGRPVIERQFLLSKRLPIDITNQIVLVDVDGTVATFKDPVTSKFLRSPYGENVDVDLPFVNIINKVNEFYYAGYTVIFVSGRKSTCGDLTVKWLEDNGVKFHHIFMRHRWDNRSDVIVKQEILDELLNLIGDKTLIHTVFDDRPRVVKGTWMANNLNVSPVYKGDFLTLEEFTTDHITDCMYINQKDYMRCPNLKCRALEDF